MLEVTICSVLSASSWDAASELSGFFPVGICGLLDRSPQVVSVVNQFHRLKSTFLSVIPNGWSSRVSVYTPVHFGIKILVLTFLRFAMFFIALWLPKTNDPHPPILFAHRYDENPLEQEPLDLVVAVVPSVVEEGESEKYGKMLNTMYALTKPVSLRSDSGFVLWITKPVSLPSDSGFVIWYLKTRGWFNICGTQSVYNKGKTLVKTYQWSVIPIISFLLINAR